MSINNINGGGNLLQRRRMMMSKTEEDPYKDFLADTMINKSGVTATLAGWTTDDKYYPYVAGHSLKWAYGGTVSSNASICFYNNGAKTDYFVANGSDRVISKANSNQVKFCVRMSAIDDSYLLDQTTGEYLWKGRNVV